MLEKFEQIGAQALAELQQVQDSKALEEFRIKYLGRRRYYHSVSLDQPLDTGEGEFYQEVADEEPDPETLLASQELQAAVQEAISSLDPDHRVVIVLRDIQDLSYEEIAQIANIKVGTVKSRIHRARSELKKKLIHKLKP